MKSLILEQELLEYRDVEIDKSNSEFEVASASLVSDFEEQKKQFLLQQEKLFNKKVEEYRKLISNKTKKEIKEDKLKIHAQRKKELAYDLIKEFEAEFEKIVNLIIEKSAKVLNAEQSNLIIEISNRQKELENKITGVKEVIFNSNLQFFEVVCKFENELVRFSLEEYIIQKVNTSIED